MSRDQDLSVERLHSTDQLVDFFRAGCKPPEQRRVGTEHEKLILRADDLSPVPYEGEAGIGRIFKELLALGSYEASYDGDNIVALVRTEGHDKGASITIEPGGQLELSGAPYACVFNTKKELDTHFDELGPILKRMGLIAVGAGMNGMHALEEVPWMPKSRYGIMGPYMKRVGTLGHWMMKMTCTVQANFDYLSEQDAASILHTAYRISPIISALFARSPLLAGKPSGHLSTRCHIWTDTDDDRSGFPRFLVESSDFGFTDWVDWTLDVPMYFVRRDGRYVDFTRERTTFRDFLRGGAYGFEATLGDYELHLSTLFPEVRMKRYIEVRGADMGPAEHICALPVLWKGLLYDEQARRDATALVAHLSVEQHAAMFDAITRQALDAVIPGPGGEPVRVFEFAAELLRYSADGLTRLADSGFCRHDELDFLAPLTEILSDPARPAGAAALLQRFHDLDGDAASWFREQQFLP